MSGVQAKHVLVDLFENLATRIHHEEKKEEPAKNAGEETKFRWNERRQALETIRDQILRYRMNL
jgi:hypothetical protein